MQALAVASVPRDQVAWITETDMIEVDRVVIEDLHIELIQMMENAGRALARLVLEAASPTTVAVVAGSGGNGGGGLVAARHLANAGANVLVVTTRPRTGMTAVTAHQMDILERMGVEQVDAVPDVDIVIDAVIGYSLRGAPRGPSERLIRETTPRRCHRVAGHAEWTRRHDGRGARRGRGRRRPLRRRPAPLRLRGCSPGRLTPETTQVRARLQGRHGNPSDAVLAIPFAALGRRLSCP